MSVNPFAAAKNRASVFLVDGRTAILVAWQPNGNRAKVFVDGRHAMVPKDDVVWPIEVRP